LDLALLIVDPEPDLALAVGDHRDAACPTWTLTHASSLEAAKQTLARCAFDAAVVHTGSDYGTTRDLLATLRAVQPDCVRLLLADPQTLDHQPKLLNTCHRVLVEPCGAHALCQAVEHTRHLRDTLGRSGLRALGMRRRTRPSRRSTGDLLSTM